MLVSQMAYFFVGDFPTRIWGAILIVAQSRTVTLNLNLACRAIGLTQRDKKTRLNISTFLLVGRRK
jgi:hypothetical protein